MTVTTDIRFKKLSETLYRVYDAGKIVGVVQKVYTGMRVAWAARRKGHVIGHADTRIGAARLLVTA